MCGFETKPLVAASEEEAAEQLSRLSETALAGEADGTPFRAHLLGPLVDEARGYLSPPAVWFDAVGESAAPRCGALDGVRLVGARVRWPGGVVRLRRDQILSARLWGVGLRFADGDRAQAATLLLHAAANAVREAVEGVRKAEQRRGRLHVCDHGYGRRFEWLALDILNEERHVATRAALAEDLFEKTDLRLRVAGLHETARVQVSAVTGRSLHERKVAAIPRPEELVLLTPRTLAIALDRPDAAELLAAAEIQRLRQRCGGVGHDRVEWLARGLHGFLKAAIARATEHPVGPLAFVPDPIRRFTRAFAAREARRAEEARQRRFDLASGLRRKAA